MEEKLVKVLLDQYKEKGIDMYALLDDTFFKDLKLDVKVDLIKKYASHISSGTSRTLTKKDIRSLIIDAAFSGLATGGAAFLATRQAAKYFVKGHVPLGVVASAVALGAGLAAGSTYMNSKKMISQRADILKRIDATVKNPTDENALSVLTTRNNQLNPIINSSIQSSTAKHIGNVANKVPGIILEQVDPIANFYSFKHHWNNPIVGGYAEGYNDDSLQEGFENAGKNMNDSFEASINRMQKTILGRD